MIRKPVSRSGSRSLFRATAVKTHKYNVLPPVSRGGIRL